MKESINVEGSSPLAISPEVNLSEDMRAYLLYLETKLELARVQFEIIRESVVDPTRDEDYSAHGHARAAGLATGWLAAWESEAPRVKDLQKKLWR